MKTTRREAETSKKMSVFLLKKKGYLDPHTSHRRRYGYMIWQRGDNGPKSEVEFFVVLNKNNGCMLLRYVCTDRESGKNINITCRVLLTTTRCNYGGKRYWFLCPIIKNGQPCGRRVGTLFSVGKLFGCRHCGKIAYRAQFEGGKYRAGSITEKTVEQAFNDVKRTHYNGKPTRKYIRYLKRAKKLNDAYRTVRILLGL